MFLESFGDELAKLADGGPTSIPADVVPQPPPPPPYRNVKKENSYSKRVGLSYDKNKPVPRYRPPPALAGRKRVRWYEKGLNPHLKGDAPSFKTYFSRTFKGRPGGFDPVGNKISEEERLRRWNQKADDPRRFKDADARARAVHKRLIKWRGHK